MRDIDAFAFNLQVRRLATPAACAALFRAAIAPFGFDTFACGELDLRDRDRTAFYIIDWPEAWQRFYVGSGMINRDPLVDALATRSEPFTWSDLRADRKLAKAGREALDLVAAEGWTEGLAVPIPRSRNRVGMISMVGHVPITDPGVVAYLSLISICLHGHVRTLLAKEGFAMPPAGLSEREMACLPLVACGLSDKAIAERLGVAASTAHEFVEKAKRRLKVKSRPELVAVAVSLGIVDL
jgi:DNA-binding CsgD family transcriptional regulator